MAFKQLVAAVFNISMTQAVAQAFQSPPVVDFSNTAVDLSAWVSLTAKLIAPAPVPYQTEQTFGTVTGASNGVITVTTSTTDLASVPPGTGKLIITGKPTSGDSVQLIAVGSITLFAS